MSDAPRELPNPNAPKPIGHLAIRGMAWTLAQTLSSKFASILAQLIIARYFLSDADFGLVAMGQIVISFASLGQSLGVGEILVRRHRRIDRWLHLGFWLNLSAGLCGMLAVWIVALVWSPAYHLVLGILDKPHPAAPTVSWLLVIWSLFLPLDAMMSVLLARLRVDMRFRLVALLIACNTVGGAVLSVIFAAMGMGAFSVVLPIPLVSACLVAAAFYLSGVRIRLAPQSRRWGHVLRDSRYFLGTSLSQSLFSQGDSMVTGMFFDQAVLGAYYWAYRMSTQTAQLVGSNLMAVLVPSFAKLDADPVRQIDAYRRTVATLLFIGMPLCFLQALLAEPAFHLLFGNKWDRALPLFTLLSCGMGFTLPMTAATAVLYAQGRYKTNMIRTIVLSILFLPTVVAGALCGSVQWVAAFVALYFVFCGPFTVVLPVIGSHVSAASFLLKTYAFPASLAFCGAAAGWSLSSLVNPAGNVEMLLLRLLGWTIATFALTFAVRPQAARDLLPQLHRLASRFRRAAPVSSET